MSIYPLTQIILYLALFFAPHDVTHITITGPDFAIELTRSDTHWTADDVRLSAADGNLTREQNGKSQIQSVTDYIKPALVNDWAAMPKITLTGHTTLEKTATGYVVRVNDGDNSAKTYTVTYQQPVRIAAGTAPASGSLTINVLGAVKTPGAYSLSAGATALDAIAQAGGATSGGNTRKVSIVRGPADEKPSVTTCDIDAVLRGQAVNPSLLDRDTLFIPERTF